MNIKEYEQALKKLSPEEFKEFNDNYGGGQLTIEQRVRNYVDETQHEPRICQLLNLKTEAQKITDSNVDSANAALKSASSAKVSMVCSIVAAIAAIIAAGIAVIDFLTK